MTTPKGLQFANVQLVRASLSRQVTEVTTGHIMGAGANVAETLNSELPANDARTTKQVMFGTWKCTT